MDHASARENEDRLHELDVELRAVRHLLERAGVQLRRLEDGARAGQDTYAQRFARLSRVLEATEASQTKLEQQLANAVAAGRQWQRELAVALVRELPQQHAPVAQHARWATPKTKSVTAEAIVNSVAPSVSDLTAAAAAAEQQSW